VDSLLEGALRQSIMDWVTERAARRGGWLAREELLGGFSVAGSPLPLIDYSRGIRNPSVLSSTLSIVSSVDGPYSDRESGDGLLHYAYRSGGSGGDNHKLRRAFELGSPLILFMKTEPNVYVPVLPDDEENQAFVVALDEAFRFIPDPAHLTTDQRRYALRIAKQRLHQPIFRRQVVSAYATQCAVCTLRHGRLLEAAHILPDSHERGLAVVSNGMSLCSIHHAAYDRNLLGVTPDFEVRIDANLLAETDGPMLLHGLQEMHGRPITLPSRPADRPDRDGLAWRYERFGSAS
jgi:putative restriction endonuclease